MKIDYLGKQCMHYIIFYVLIYLRLPSLKYNIFIFISIVNTVCLTNFLQNCRVLYY